MHQARRRNRRPTPRRDTGPDPAPDQAQAQAQVAVTAGADVVLVGYFSAKEKDFAAIMDAAAAQLAARGVRVAERIIQRRGVSNGGVTKMTLPYSTRTLVSYGKAREVAAACEHHTAQAAIFVSPLTARQRHVLTQMLGCPALSLNDLPPHHDPPPATR